MSEHNHDHMSTQPDAPGDDTREPHERANLVEGEPAMTDTPIITQAMLKDEVKEGLRHRREREHTARHE